MPFGKLIEQVLEVHAGGDIPALPQDIDHLQRIEFRPSHARWSRVAKPPAAHL